MTPVQSRMARAALDWSIKRLAREAGLGVNTVMRFQAGNEALYGTVQKIQSVLEAAEVEFLDGDAPGIRLRQKPGASDPDEYQAAWSRGREAFLQHRHGEANPHNAGSRADEGWQDGFNEEAAKGTD